MQAIKGQTGCVTKASLESKVSRVQLEKRFVSEGTKMGVKVLTSMAGNGAELELVLTDINGQRCGKVVGKVYGNQFVADISIPKSAEEVIYVKANLNKGDSKESEALFVVTPVKISNAKWDKQDARRGDILKTFVELRDVPESGRADISIWNFDGEGENDLIASFPVRVKDQRITYEWEFDYHEDTDAIPTEEDSERGYNPPEYFFRVEVQGVVAESPCLVFKDWIEIEIKTPTGEVIADREFIAIFPNGEEKKGKTDDEGRARLEDVPPGPYSISFETE